MELLLIASTMSRLRASDEDGIANEKSPSSKAGRGGLFSEPTEIVPANGEG